MWSTIQARFYRFNLRDVVNAAHEDNAIAQQAFTEIGRWLLGGFGSSNDLLNLEMIIVGGPMAAAGDYLLLPLQKELAQRVLPTRLG